MVAVVAIIGGCTVVTLLCVQGFIRQPIQQREVKGILGEYAVIMDAHLESEIVLGLDLRMLSDLCYHGSIPLLKMRYMSSEQIMGEQKIECTRLGEFHLFVNPSAIPASRLQSLGGIGIDVSSKGLSTVHHVFHSWLYILKPIETVQAAVWMASYQLTNLLIEMRNQGQLKVFFCILCAGTSLVLGFSLKGQCLWKPPQIQVPMRAVIDRQ